MNFSTISAILRGRWLIDKSYAETQLPIIVSMLKNHQGNFAIEGAEQKEDSSEEKPAIKISSAASAPVYRVGYYTKINDLPQGSVAFVDLVGPIMKYGGMCSYGSVDKADLLKKLNNSSNVAGVILNVDSPGGQVDGTTLLADQIKSMNKPVVAMVDDGMMASAAMWIGSAANEIYATKKSDSFGSIGVYATLYDWNAYMKAEGLPVHEIYAPQSSEKNKDYRDALNGDYSGMKSDLADIAQVFIDTVAANRPAAAASMDTWSKGGMYNATKAKKMGLIDGIKSFDQIVERISTLASSNNNKKNTMSAGAFQNTLSASKADAFEVVEGGFLLTEENLNNIEARINDLQTANDLATDANNQLTENGNQRIAEMDQLRTDNTASAERIQALEAELTTLRAATVAPASTAKAADDFGTIKEVSAVTKEANRLRAIKGLPPIQ